MNWEAITAIAEIIASLGVIISLLYLAHQMRNQTEDNKVATDHELVNNLDSLWGSISADEKLASIFLKGLRDLDSLEPVEAVQFSFLFNRWFRMVESILDRYQKGLLNENQYFGISQGMKEICKYPGLKSWWHSREHIFEPDFRDWVSQLFSSDQPSLYERE